MKFQYLFDIQFIRIAAKTDLFDDFRLLLAVDPTKSTPALKNKYYHNLKLPRDQRIINLKQLEPFRFSVDEEDQAVQCYSLQLRDTSSLAEIQIIPLITQHMIRTFEKVGKTVHDQRHEGTYMNINFKVVVSKEEVEKENLYTSIETSPRLSPTPSKEEAGELKQTLSRVRRPTQLNIRKKSDLKESQKLKESQRMKAMEEQAAKQTGEVIPLFRVMGKEESPRQQIVVNVIEEKESRGWEPLSAVPEALSAWLKKRVRSNENEIQEVKELLESHHPLIEEHPVREKLSIKLKIVIGLLIFGFFVLVIDMLKKETYRLVYGNYPKLPKPAGQKSARKGAKKDPRERKHGKKDKGKGVQVKNEPKGVGEEQVKTVKKERGEVQVKPGRKRNASVKGGKGGQGGKGGKGKGVLVQG